MGTAKHLIVVAAAAFALALSSGCAAQVGDSCDVAADCGRGQICETSMPGGYCTAPNCEFSGCVDSGICIVFGPSVSYCMMDCESNSDCRDDYVCVQDFGEHGFCNSVSAPPDGP